MRNYTSVYIDGTTNLCTSSFKDHASSDMHARAMMLLKKDCGADVHEEAPIVRALSTMDEVSRDKMKKFNVAFVIVKKQHGNDKNEANT